MIIEAFTAPLAQRSMPMSDPRAWSPFDHDIFRSVLGRSLTPEEIYLCSVAWRCMMLLAGTVAKLQINLWRDLPKGGRELAKNHRRWEIITRVPNRFDTMYEFEETAMLRKLMWGAYYEQLIFEDGNPNGNLLERNPLHPSFVEPKYDKETDDIVYHYNPPNGQKRTFPRRKIHSRRGPSFEGRKGIALTQAAANAIALCRFYDEYQARFFGNDASPAGALIAPTKLDDKARLTLRESWERAHRGLRNSHKVAILDGGLEWKQFSITNRESQFAESVDHNEICIARFFGIVHLHKLGKLERSTNNNIAHQDGEYYSDAVDPHLVGNAQAMERDLLLPHERGVLHIEYDRQELKRTDIETRERSTTTLVLGAVLTPNEGRARIGMNPTEGGDVLLQPSAHVPIGTKPPEKLAARDESDRSTTSDTTDLEIGAAQVRTSFAPLLKDVAERIVSRETIGLEKHVKALLRGADQGEFVENLGDFYSKHRDFVARALEPVFASMIGLLGENTALLPTEARKMALEAAKTHCLRSMEDLLSMGNKPDQEQFDSLFKRWMEERSAMIAQDEMEAITRLEVRK